MKHSYKVWALTGAMLWGGAGTLQAQEIVADTAQTERQAEDLKELANPGVIGMNRSKGLIVRYEFVPRFGVYATAQQGGIPDSEKTAVRRNNKYEIKAYVPVVNNPHFKLVVGGGYFVEEYNFKRPEEEDYPLYKNLQDKDLRSISGQVLMLKPLNEDNFLITRFKGELNGDYGKSNISLSKYLKSSLEAIYGWKKSPSFAWGVGVQLGYNFGRQTIYPDILYNRTFNERWGVEAIFPANVTLRRNFSEKSYLYMGYKVDGASYNINIDSPPFNSPPLSEIETIELRKSEIRGRIRWEREIYDFLWFGLETGYRNILQFAAYDGENVKANALIKNHMKDAVFLNVEIFLVPPRRFLKP